MTVASLIGKEAARLVVGAIGIEALSSAKSTRYSGHAFAHRMVALLGKGNGAFAPRVRIGIGDGRADLLGMDSGGGTYSYEGTGDYRKPFRSRVATSLANGSTWSRPEKVF